MFQFTFCFSYFAMGLIIGIVVTSLIEVVLQYRRGGPTDDK